MSLMKPLPEKWDINQLLLPAKNHRYFEHWQQHPFQPKSSSHSDVNAWWMAECALLAYEEQNVIENRLKGVETFTKDGQLHLEWINQGSTQGFMLEADDFILLVVRGTEFYSFSEITKNPKKIWGVVEDLLVDAKLTLVQPRDQGAGHYMLAEGFFNEFDSIQPQLKKFFTTTDKPIWLTGHSLGGAIATLATFYCSLEKTGGLYTFGSPCVGDQDFAKAFNQKGLNPICFRYTNGKDLVAKGLTFWRGIFFLRPRFRHIGNEKKLRSKQVFFDYFLPLDMADHAPIYYALKCWNYLIHQNANGT